MEVDLNYDLSTPSTFQRMQAQMSGIIDLSINSEIERIVREHAVPKIKGELTFGKLRWRGIKLASLNMIGNSTYEIYQRDKLIGSFKVYFSSCIEET